jgi:tetratricopeptide (TPR) repeat protein
MLFALAHVHPVQVCSAFMLGIALHLVFLSTKSLIAPFLLHSLNNALDFSVAKFALSGFDITGPEGLEHIPGWLFVAALGAVIALGLLLHATRVCWVTPDGTSWSPGFATAETPPAAVAAVPKLRRPRRAFNVFVAVVYLAFTLVFAHTTGSWRALACANRGSVLIDEGNCEQAIVELNRAIALDPGLAWAYFNRGVAYGEKGDLDGEIADYTQAIRINPEYGEAYRRRGEAYNKKGEKSKAETDFAEAKRLGSSGE